MNDTQAVLWSSHIIGECLREAGGDINAALSAASYILATQPIPEGFALSIDATGHEHRGKGKGGGQFTSTGSRPNETELRVAERLGFPTTYSGTIGNFGVVVDNPLPKATIPTNRAEFLEDYRDGKGRKTLPVGEIKTIQDWVRPTIVEAYLEGSRKRDKDDDDEDALPSVMLVEDELVLLDGNHELLGAIARGEKFIEVEYSVVSKESIKEAESYLKRHPTVASNLGLSLSVDVQGHQHRGKGKGGGQFTSTDNVTSEVKQTDDKGGYKVTAYIEGKRLGVIQFRLGSDKVARVFGTVTADFDFIGKKLSHHIYREAFKHARDLGATTWESASNQMPQTHANYKKLGAEFIPHIPDIVWEASGSKEERRGVYRIDLTSSDKPLSVDVQGHQHRGKGKGGGQFTSTGGGNGASKQKPDRRAAQEDYKRHGTKAKAFKSWFGDWEKGEGSKVVDEEGAPAEKHSMPGNGSMVRDKLTGKPYMVFHGTPKPGWDTFDIEKTGHPNSLVYGRGFYFASNAKQSEHYAGESGEVKQVYLNIRKPFDMNATVTREEFEELTGRKMGLWKRLSRYMNQAGELTGHDVFEALSKGGGKQDNGAATKRLQELGYDGITHTFGASGTQRGGDEKDRVWIAFEPNQIKSVDNVGTFDPDEPSINLSVFLAHDIHNPQAQGILNRTLKAAKGLSASARKDLTAALKATNSGEAIVNFIAKYRLQLARLLTATQLAAVLEGAREVSGKVPVLATFPGAVLPPPTLEPEEAVALVDRLAQLSGQERAEAIYALPTEQQAYVWQAIAAKEASPPIRPPSFAPPRPRTGSQEDIHFPIIDEAVKELSEKNVIDRQRFDALDAAARAKAFTVANVAAEETLTKIRDSLAENVKEGADYETWKGKVLADVDAGTFMSDAHQETVFRTNVQSAFSDGQATVLTHPLVRSGFPYSAYDAIHDDRVRENHLALEKHGIGETNVYRTDDPVFQLFRPPWDYNDRCGWTPLTVRQAAERGIAEAQEWLRTGIEPTPKAFVAMPPFEPPPGFQRAVAAAPLSIQLSMQSMASFGLAPTELDEPDEREERHQLTAEILVALFGGDAVEVAEELCQADGDDGVALANGSPPKVKKRYGPRPGPNWRPGGVSRLGTQIWLWGAHPSAPSPAHTAAPTPPVPPTPVPTPAVSPTPPAPTPTPTPAPTSQYAIRQAAAVVAYNAAMARLNAGGQLTSTEKADLAKDLTALPVGMLRSLATAIGGSAAASFYRNVDKKTVINDIKAVLTGAGTTPTAPTPTPAPAVPHGWKTGLPEFDDAVADALAGKNLTQQQINDAANAARVAWQVRDHHIEQAILALGGTVTSTGGPVTISSLTTDLIATLRTKLAPPTPPPPNWKFTRPPLATIAPAPTASGLPTVPMKDEIDWVTGKAEPGSLNGVDFAPAPPKFWANTPDKDIGEPPSLKRVDRVSVMIQEPDGRVWIVQPTNEFGNRKYTMPGGGVEPGLTDQQNALKEIWEETGLQVEITGHLGDFEDSNTKKNGRLYIGKRIGGQPWDAKPEPGKIPPSRKTGTTAESEAVTLVTPERAAQLLHRTDDLAQLMTVLPPPVDTPVEGKGSEPLKKLFAAIQPKSKAYKKGGKKGDGDLHAVQEMRGFNRKPVVVSKNAMDTLVAQGGHIEVLRGLSDTWTNTGQVTADQLADQFRDGEHFPGYGCFGNGTYADGKKGSSNVATSQYSTYGGGNVVRIAIPKTAKIIKQSELEKKVPKPPKGYTGSKTGGSYPDDEQWWGVQAAIAGYDAIEVDGKSRKHGGYGAPPRNNYYVILNRSILTVQKENAKGHIIK